MMINKDYYWLLGITDTASADEIKSAYRKLAMQYHPDRNRGNEEWAGEKFKEVNEAFSVLGDPKKKRRYDQYGAVWCVSGVRNYSGEIFEKSVVL